MKQNATPFFVILVAICLIIFITFLIHLGNLAVLFPQGLIAQQERTLILTVFSLAAIVVIPVLIAIFFISWKFREGNIKNVSMIDLSTNNRLKITWWLIPFILMAILAVVAWKAAHQLDPFQRIASPNQQMTIQVVALRWKWLFIYPKEDIATVNLVAFPIHTPVDFALTAADAPMNSFWIPSLGGQMYAMEAMENHLHLLSNVTGDFPGETAEINGSGYAGMRFTARVTTQKDFDNWVSQVKKIKKPLNLSAYTALSQPSEYNPVTMYSPVDKNLYTTIIMKYMQPNSVGANMHH